MLAVTFESLEAFSKEYHDNLTKGGGSSSPRLSR